MSTDFILMEGIRMVDEWPIIEKKIPSFDIVFRPVVDPSMIEVGAGAGPDASGAERRGAAAVATGRIRLAPEEERVFRKVDGVRTVQAIIDGTGSGEFEVCRTLFDFLNRNLVAPAGTGTTPSLEQGGPEAAASPVPGYLVAALVVVLAVAGVAVQRRSPFAVTALPPLLRGSYEAVLDGTARARLARLERGVEAWRATTGTPPDTLEELVRVGLADSSSLRDPWGRPFHYERGRQGYVLAAVDASGRSRADATLDRRGGR
jgi:hypothetical protein